MASYRLPDNRILDIDLDQLDAKQKVDLQNWLAATYPDTFDKYIEKDLQGYTAEFIKGIPRGGLQTLASSIEGVVNLFDAGNESAIGESLRSYQESLNKSKLIGVGEGYEDAFATKLGSGLGSFASFLVPGGLAGKIAGRAGKGLSIKQRQEAYKKGATRGAAAVAIPAGIAEQGRNIERSRELGEEVGFGQEIASELLGGAIGFSEVLPVERLLRYIPKGYAPIINNRIGTALTTGFFEGGQEAVAAVMQDLVARGIYSEELPIGDSMLDDFTIGGAVGFIADLALRNRMGNLGGEYQREKEKEARARRDKAKFKQRELFEQTPESKIPDVDPNLVLPDVEPSLTALDDNKVNSVKANAAKLAGNLKIATKTVTDQIDTINNNFGYDYGVVYVNEAFDVIAENIRQSDLSEARKIAAIQGNERQREAELERILERTLKESPLDEPEEPVQKLNTFNKEPIKEELQIIDNPNGTFSVVGQETATDYGGIAFPDYNTAAIEAKRIKDNLDENFIDSSIKQSLYLQGNYGNGTAYKIGSLIVDNKFNDIDRVQIANLDSTINVERKTKLEDVKGAQQKIRQGIINDYLGEGTLSEEQISTEERKIERAEPNTPFASNKVQPDSLVDLFNTKVQKLGLPIKKFYTVSEAKKILNKKDFNDLMSERSSIVFKEDIKSGDIVEARRNKDYVETSLPSIKQTLEKKNINTEITDPAFEYFAEQVTGEKKYANMNQGQKELLASRLRSLPRFDVVSFFPDFRPRPYTTKAVNDFYVNNKGNVITNETLKENIKKRDGKNLSQNDIKLLREDLINSGRAVKQKNKLKLTFDFENQQARRANGLNESQVELRQRLQDTTALSTEEINQKVELDVEAEAARLDEKDIKMLPPPATLEKYERLFEIFRGRLKEYGLEDVGLKFTTRIKAASNLKEVDGKLEFEVDPSGEAAYDSALNKIFIAFNVIDPQGTKTERELRNDISGVMDHEIIHALRELDLLTEREYNLLVTYAKNTLSRIKVLNEKGEEVSAAKKITASYVGEGTPNLDPISLDEEFVAELFRFYKEKPDQVRGKSKNIIGKILDFISSIFDAITGAGFRTPLGVLEDIKTGKIGRRQRDEIRSNKDILAEEARGDVPVVDLKFSVNREKIERELSAARSELYNAESVLRADGNRVGRRTYNALYKRYQDANNKVIYLESELDKIPRDPQQLFMRFSRGTISPIEIFGDGEIEQTIERAYKDNGKQLTGKQIEDIASQFGLRPSPKRKWVGTKELEESIKDGLAQGYDPFWYERWAQITEDIGEANINEFSGVFGITSEQAKPEKNLQDTLRTMIIARRVDPDKNPKQFVEELRQANVGNKNTARLERILSFYNLGILKRSGESGQKTATYGLEIQRAARNMFTPFTVIDRHMLRKFGIDAESAGQKEYRILQALMGNIAKNKGNNFKSKDGTPLNISLPRQIQAVIWAQQRYSGATRIDNEGSYETSRQASAKELSEINQMKIDGSFSSSRPLNGKFIYEPEYSNNLKTDPMSTEVSKDLYNVTMNNSPVLALELKPGVNRGYLPRTATIDQRPLSFADFRNFQLDVLKSITDGNQIRFLQKLGIPHRVTESVGSFEDGGAVPNVLVQFPNSTDTEIKDIGRLLADAQLQDAFVFFKPVTRGKQSTGLIFVKEDNSLLTQTELNELVRDMKNINPGFDFTLLAGKQVGPMILDPDSFDPEIEYDSTNFNNFIEVLVPLANEKGYNVKNFNGDTDYISYERQEGTNKGGYSQALERIRSRRGGFDTSSLQREALSSLYIPIYKKYQEFTGQLDDFVLPPPPYTLEDSAIGPIGSIGLKAAEAKARAIKEREDLSPYSIPKFNENANPLALAIAYDYQDGKITDDDLPPLDLKYSRTTSVMPEKYKELSKKVGETPIEENKTFGEAVLNSFAFSKGDNATSFLDRIYKEIVDNYSFVARGIETSVDKLREEGDFAAAEAENRAGSGAIQALRHAEKANQITAQVMTKGVPTIKRGDKDLGLTTVIPFRHGGAVDILAPLYNDPSLLHEGQYIGEQLFKILAVSSRSSVLNEQGKEVPVNEKDIQKAQEIRTDYPVVAKVYDQFQEFNNAIIQYGVDTGLIEGARDPIDLAKDIDAAAKKFNIDGLKFNALKELGLQDLIPIAQNLNAQLASEKDFENIRIKSIAEIWVENSAYYPFYRKMVDDSIAGPNIASGSLVGNPMNIRLKGSQEALEPAPIDVIFRNIQAIVNAGAKNEGVQRLMELHRKAGRAELATASTPITQKVTVYENGKKVEYQVADPLLIDGLLSTGVADDSGLFVGTFAGAANILREGVTRDPIFMFRNLIRDSLVSRTITGTTYTPIIDTFKAFNSDMDDLERRGIIGGYDASRDPRDAAKFFRKVMKERKMDEFGSLNPLDSVVRLWDYLGELTTRSDGATRNVVYREVLDKTDSQAEAAYQALEIMNFNRRGGNYYFKLVTAAIPFLNARIQGLDVLRRGLTGKYSAVKKLQGQSTDRKELENEIFLGTLGRGAFLSFLTMLYYLAVSDEEEYKNARRETRDDNWIVPLGKDIPALKVPIPFEVGVLFKVIPERFLDATLGDATFEETMTSIGRQLRVTLTQDPFGFQLIKPLYEVWNNKSAYLGTDIVPYYLKEGVSAQAQYNENTSEFAKGLSLGLAQVGIDVSPIHLDYLVSGYTGTIGVYVSAVADAVAKNATGQEVVPRDIERLPFFRSVLQAQDGGGLAQEFYEMRKESNQFIGTLNKLIKEGRAEEINMYHNNPDGLIETRADILKLNRFLAYTRDQIAKIRGDKSMSPELKKKLIDQINFDKQRRLAYFLPEIRDKIS